MEGYAILGSSCVLFYIKGVYNAVHSKMSPLWERWIVKQKVGKSKEKLYFNYKCLSRHISNHMFILYDRFAPKTLGNTHIMYPRSRLKKALETILLFEFINSSINFFTAVFIPKSKSWTFLLGDSVFEILFRKWKRWNNGSACCLSAIYSIFIALLALTSSDLKC